MEYKQVYRGMTVAEGVAHVEKHYSATDMRNVNRFSDLHELCDANMTLPFPDDCGKHGWLEFANEVVAEFDLKMKQETAEQER